MRERTVSNNLHYAIGRPVRRLAVCLAYATLIFGIAGTANTVTPVPASAQNLFDFFFGSPRRPTAPSSASAYADPSRQTESSGQPGQPRVEVGPAVAYCVRLCDGRFFPIQRSGATPAEVCSAFCPASRTKIFSGESIDHAVARDGTHYADLGNALAYRDKIVPGCTCNGKDAFGLVGMKPADDPTLRPGDVVATDSGFVTYNGGRNRNGDFTPIDSSHSGLSAQWRRELAQTKIAPSERSALPAPTTNGMSSDHQAQLDR